MDVQINLQVVVPVVEGLLGPCQDGLLIVVDEQLVLCR